MQIDKEEPAAQPVEVDVDDKKDEDAKVPGLQDGSRQEVPPVPEPIVPISIQRLHRRLSKEIGLHKLRIKHYRTSVKQLKATTSELVLPDETYEK